MADRRTKYSPETKAAAMAALLAGQSVGEIASAYNVSIGTLRSWQSRSLDRPLLATAKRELLGDLLLGYLHANLVALHAQTQVFSDQAWLRKQDADAAAVLHGVMCDKAVRLLEAMTRAAPVEPAGAEP